MNSIVLYYCGKCQCYYESVTHVCKECVLSRVQKEVSEWAQQQFGNNASHDPRYQVAGIGYDLHSIPPLLGMIEELGELCAPVCKRHQGRNYMDPGQYKAKVQDALADLLIFMCDYARREGIDLATALSTTWEVVKRRTQRNWEKDKEKEVTVVDEKCPRCGLRVSQDVQTSKGIRRVCRSCGSPWTNAEYHDDDERPTGDFRPEDERLPMMQTSSGEAGLRESLDLPQVEREDLPNPPVEGGYRGDQLEDKPSPADVSIALARGWMLGPDNVLCPPVGDKSRHWAAVYVPVWLPNKILAVQTPRWLNRRMKEIEQEEYEKRGQTGLGWSEPAEEPVKDGWFAARTIAGWLSDPAEREALRLIERLEREFDRKENKRA